MATHSSILAWRIPCTEGPGGLQQWGHKELDTTEHTHTLVSKYMISFWLFMDVKKRLYPWSNIQLSLSVFSKSSLLIVLYSEPADLCLFLLSN